MYEFLRINPTGVTRPTKKAIHGTFRLVDFPRGNLEFPRGNRESQGTDSKQSAAPANNLMQAVAYVCAVLLRAHASKSGN